MKRWMGLALPLAIAACDKSSAEQTTTAPSATTSAAATATASAAASATPSASASAAPTGAAASFAGTYKSAPGDLKDWKDLAKWQDNGTVGVGEGAIRVEVDPTGKVSGELDAPLGPATLNGVYVDGAFSAHVDRKDPSDRGFTGTAIGKAKGDAIEGTMRLSLADANSFRSVTFAVKKK